MNAAPSIKEALEQLVAALEMDYPERPTRNALPPSALTFVMIYQAKAALATLSPPAGGRREAIARIKKLTRYAFNEGFAQGMKEATSYRGGKTWDEFKSNYENDIDKAFASAD